MISALAPAVGNNSIAGFDVLAAAATTRVVLSFVTSDDPGSWAIRQYDHGAFSHVDCLLPDGRYLGARDDILAGVPRGVQMRPPGYFKFKGQLLVEIRPPMLLCRAFYSFIATQLGKPYDVSGLISNFTIGRDWRSADSWWCSELHGAALETGILTKPLSTPLNKLTPDGLALAAQGAAYRWQ